VIVMSFTVEVRTRIVGAAPNEGALEPIALDLLKEQMTVAELIAMTVEEQVRDLVIHRKLDAEKARHLLDRQYLTDEEARRQAEQGAIRFPNAKTLKVPEIDTQAEVRKALAAFESGAVAVFVDGFQPDTLGDVVTLDYNSKVTFLRMTPLVGG
jgi:hypothetical protein